jgi:hypothetical protein
VTVLLRVVSIGLLAVASSDCVSPDSSRSDSGGARPSPETAVMSRGLADSSDLARAFVQEFYDWYARLAVDTTRRGNPLDSVLARNAPLLGSRLAAALDEDIRTRREPGLTEPAREFLNFDPFLDSQDPCKPYEAMSARPWATGGYRVSVRQACGESANRDRRPLAMHVAPEAGGWLITDVIYGDTSSIIGYLCRLAQGDDRPDRRPKDCASWPSIRAGLRGVQSNPPPPMPWIANSVCPGEACVLGPWAACATVVAQTEARSNAPVAFTMNRGERFEALSGDVHVKTTGMVVFTDTFTYSAVWEIEGPNEKHLFFTPADTIYLLDYRGEGYLTWWLHGHAETGMIFWNSRMSGGFKSKVVRLVREPEQEWWVNVENARGQRGWIIPSYATVAGPGSDHYDDGPQRCASSPRP